MLCIREHAQANRSLLHYANYPRRENETTAAAANGPFSEIDCGIFWRLGEWGARLRHIVMHCERSNDFLSPNDKIAAAVDFDCILFARSTCAAPNSRGKYELGEWKIHRHYNQM